MADQDLSSKKLVGKRGKGKGRTRPIDSLEVARYRTARLTGLNGAAAVAAISADRYDDPKNRAVRIEKKIKKQPNIDFVKQTIEQLSVRAVVRVGELVESSNERVASNNSQFLIDHAIGKAVQRNDNRNLNLNVQSILD